MRFFLQLITVINLLTIADEGFLTGPEVFNDLNENCSLLNVSIAIIGAGFSGLSAFNHLSSIGLHNVQIFEASNRVGGRVYPLEFEGIFLQQGAEFINGEDNAIYKAASRLGLITGEVDDSALISEDAQFVSSPNCQISQDKLNKFAEFSSFLELKYAEMAMDNREIWSKTVAQVFDRDYEEFLRKMNASKEDRLQYDSLAKIYRGYYEGEWSAPIDKLALHNYVKWKDGSKSFPFSSFTLNSRGYAPILAELVENVPVNKLNLNSRVVQIDYRGKHVRLKLQKTNNDQNLMEEEWLSTHFDFVIITVPIGHLKQFSSTMFLPQLPKNKLKIIEAIGFGSMEKVFLVYDKPFWPENMTSLIALNCNYEEEEEGRIRDSLHTLQPHPWAKNRILVLWLSGNGPRLVNALTDSMLSDLITKHLREVLQDRNIRPPVKIIRTKWLNDQNFLGSYTYITPQSSLISDDPFSILAEPIYSKKDQKLKLLFAGEGTHSQIFQTTIGAFESGQREAERIKEYLIGINKC
uniref:Amine oxidase domain-containing protein n=2 Tax=Meloidogyne enterolobii TaxID=390850 RepID=A0A6V7UJJ2_MELEN|nr:unnamed protein product [Meloidogyne enterolobii]